MTYSVEVLSIGQSYSNEEIYQALGVGNAGGVRIKLDSLGEVRRAALFTAFSTSRQISENPYKDRIEGDVLVYTGTGRSGDQAVSGVNARLHQQPERGFPMYGFAQTGSRRSATIGAKRWAFLGLLDLLRSNQERQLDASGKWRTAWVFELYVHSKLKDVAVALDRETAEVARQTSGWQLKPLDREIPKSTESDRPLPDIDILEPIRKKLLAIEPRRFETFIKELLVNTGFEKVEVTRYSQDGGIDVNARAGSKAWAIRDLLVQVQAKRWLHTVGRREIAELRGSLQPHAAGCIVTTSQFSRAAILESLEPGKTPITIINGIELAGLTQAAHMQIE